MHTHTCTHTHTHYIVNACFLRKVDTLAVSYVRVSAQTILRYFCINLEVVT